MKTLTSWKTHWTTIGHPETPNWQCPAKIRAAQKYSSEVHEGCVIYKLFRVSTLSSIFLWLHNGSNAHTLCLLSTVCKEPPYKVEESGYAGFLMPIEVYFKNKVRRSGCDSKRRLTSLTKPLTGKKEDSQYIYQSGFYLVLPKLFILPRNRLWWLFLFIRICFCFCSYDNQC